MNVLRLPIDTPGAVRSSVRLLTDLASNATLRFKSTGASPARRIGEGDGFAGKASGGYQKIITSVHGALQAAVVHSISVACGVWTLRS